MDGAWLPQIPDESFSGALKVAPLSVDRLKRISLQPLPWKSDHAAYTFPDTGSATRSVLSLEDPLPNVLVARSTVRTYLEPSVEWSLSLAGA